MQGDVDHDTDGPGAETDALPLLTAVTYQRPGDLERHQDRIRAGLADVDRWLASEPDQHEGSRRRLNAALSLLVDGATLDARTNDRGKRPATPALTNGIEINEDDKGDDPTRRAVRRPRTRTGIYRCRVFYYLFNCGAEGTRTPDPLHAMEVRYQLRHSPVPNGFVSLADGGVNLIIGPTRRNRPPEAADRPRRGYQITPLRSPPEWAVCRRCARPGSSRPRPRGAWTTSSWTARRRW